MGGSNDVVAHYCLFISADALISFSFCFVASFGLTFNSPSCSVGLKNISIVCPHPTLHLQSRVLVAALANGKRVTVKIKLGNTEYLAPSQESRPPKDSQESKPWLCHTCKRTNLSTKKRCRYCQSWRGGKRKKSAEGDKKSVALSNEEEEEEEVNEAPKKVFPPPPSERDDDQEEDPDLSMGARLPKRNRTNLYSSLSPAVIQATAKARAEAYAANPPSPQLASRSNKRKQSYDKKDDYVHRPAIAADIVTGGTVLNEFVGNDGNLFYCLICLGVGEVVCCDGCPHVFHPRCLPAGPSKTSLEDDDDPWFCHECWEDGKATTKPVHPTKRQRKVKERCSECGRKETKDHPCVPCPKRNCDNFFHLLCPSEDGDDALIEDSPQRSLCSSCKAVRRDKNGSYLQYGQRKLRQNYGAQRELLSSGRGRGRGGRGGKVSRRMSSSAERKKRLRDSDEYGLITMRGSNRSHSSGFQSPYVDIDEDDDDVGPHSLAYVEKPTSSTPAFFFFLLHNRSVIEKSLSRMSPIFRGMARGLARNEKVAQEGAVIWIGLSQKERSEWVNVSMKDFEQRIVAWKEKEAIEAMIQSMDANDTEAQRNFDPKNESNLLPAHIAGPFTRMNQLNKVKSHPVKVCARKNGNPILLELLYDVRFRPLPLVDMSRTNDDLAQRKVGVAVQQFTAQGPVETSLGDDCMGCTRGWSHFCSVVKRPLPGSEHRAKLQPPVRYFIHILLSTTSFSKTLLSRLPHRLNIGELLNSYSDWFGLED